MEEILEDLLNFVKGSTRDTQEVIHLGEEKVFTAVEVATAIKRIKSGKDAGEDEIRREMLKALTGEEILWLTRVCHVRDVEAVKFLMLPLSAPLEVLCFRVHFGFLTFGIFCFCFQLRIKLVASKFASASCLFH